MLAGRAGSALGLAMATVAVAAAPSASAVLVYERPASHSIVMARDDGTKGRVIAHGQHPVVAPGGRKVAFLNKVRAPRGDLRMRGTVKRGSVLLAHGISTLTPAVWSPDGSYIVAQSDSRSDAVVIDVKRRRRHSYPEAAFYGGASFAPDSSRIAFAGIDHSGGLLYAAVLPEGRSDIVADGFSPAWGAAGLAYTDGFGRVYLKRTPTARPKPVLDEPGADPHPLAWATHARRLLVTERLETDEFKALIVNPDTGAVVENPNAFSQVDAIASHGHTILAESDGNVVAAREGGTLHILATHARAASWTK